MGGIDARSYEKLLVKVVCYIVFRQVENEIATSCEDLRERFRERAQKSQVALDRSRPIARSTVQRRAPRTFLRENDEIGVVSGEGTVCWDFSVGNRLASKKFTLAATSSSLSPPSPHPRVHLSHHASLASSFPRAPRRLDSPPCRLPVPFSPNDGRLVLSHLGRFLGRQDQGATPRRVLQVSPMRHPWTRDGGWKGAARLDLPTNGFHEEDGNGC